MTFHPEVEVLEDRTVPTSFTLTSPTTFGLLPEGISPVGGVVLDLVGQSGVRVVSQLNASSLYRGVFNTGTPIESRGNPGTIGTQTGFSDELLSALGDGLSELAVRVTVFDGDTGVGNFDRNENRFLLNDVDLGDFSSVITEETSSDGETTLSVNTEGGFRDEKLDTGFFYTDDPAVLAEVFQSLESENSAVFQLEDDDPFDNFFDFTQGIDGAFADIERPPKPVNQPPRIDEVTSTLEPDGRTVLITVKAVDPDMSDGGLTFDFDFDNDGSFELSNQTGVVSFTFSEDGTFPVNIRVRDSEGGEASESISVEALAPNVPPLIEEVTSTLGTDGRTVLITVNAVDPDMSDGGLTFDFDFDNDGSFELSNQTGVVSFTFSEDGTFPVNIRVRDSEGGEASESISVEALAPNVPPRIDEVTSTLEPDGRTVLITVNAVDPDMSDGGLTFDFDFDNDGSFELSNQTGVVRVSFAEDGTYPVSIRVRDSEGGEASESISVEALAPQVEISLPETALSALYLSTEELATEELPALTTVSDSAIVPGREIAFGASSSTSVSLLELTPALPSNGGLVAGSADGQPQESGNPNETTEGTEEVPMPNGAETPPPKPPIMQQPRGPPEILPVVGQARQAAPARSQPSSTTPPASAVPAQDIRPSNGRVTRMTLALLVLLLLRRRYKRSRRSLVQRLEK
ncbi:MAG: PKD domain-containing protein [Gemmataceae bacterium]